MGSSSSHVTSCCHRSGKICLCHWSPWYPPGSSPEAWTAAGVGTDTYNSDPHRLWWRSPWLVRRHWGLGQNLQTTQASASLSASRDCIQGGLGDVSPILPCFLSDLLQLPPLLSLLLKVGCFSLVQRYCSGSWFPPPPMSAFSQHKRHSGLTSLFRHCYGPH